MHSIPLLIKSSRRIEAPGLPGDRGKDRSFVSDLQGLVTPLHHLSETSSLLVKFLPARAHVEFRGSAGSSEWKMAQGHHLWFCCCIPWPTHTLSSSVSAATKISIALAVVNLSEKD